jgi:hypothetical protein
LKIVPLSKTQKCTATMKIAAAQSGIVAQLAPQCTFAFDATT